MPETVADWRSTAKLGTRYSARRLHKPQGRFVLEPSRRCAPRPRHVVRRPEKAKKKPRKKQKRAEEFSVGKSGSGRVSGVGEFPFRGIFIVRHFHGSRRAPEQWRPSRTRGTRKNEEIPATATPSDDPDRARGRRKVTNPTFSEVGPAERTLRSEKTTTATRKKEKKTTQTPKGGAPMKYGRPLIVSCV